jgi:hypothetical protein
MYSQSPYGYTPQQPGMSPQWPALAQRPKRRVSGCIKALVITAVTVFVLVGSCIYIVAKHPRWLLRVFNVEPTEYALATAVSDGRTVHVLYHNESFIPVMVKGGEEPEFEIGALAFHGTFADGSWSDLDPVEPFSSAVWFQDALWVFHDGGCRTLVNGQWENVLSDTEWVFPVASLLGQKLCLFYTDAKRTLRVATSTDGRQWTPGKLERPLPKPNWNPDVVSHFVDKADPPFRVAMLRGSPYVFWYDWRTAQLYYICYRRGWTEPQVAVQGSEVDVVAAGGRIYLFELFDFRDGQNLLLEPAKVGMYIFDGSFWSEQQDLGFKTTGCLNASGVGNDVWLFTSENGRLVYRILSNGQWSKAQEVPKPKNVWKRPATAH